MINQVIAGRVMVGIAIVGLIVSLVGTIVGQQLVSDLDAGVGQSLELTSEVLVTVDDSFEIAEDALVIVVDGVAEAEVAVRSLSGSMAEGQAALETATELTGGEIADALESVENALPPIQAAARTIDQTLSALNSLPFGPSYSPDRPLGETIGELREGLDGLPEELREQAAQVGRTSEELTSATEGAIGTADSLVALEERLSAAVELVGQYEDRTAEARALVNEQRDVIAASTTRARFMVVAFGIVFALSQFVPFYLGLGLINGGWVDREP